MVDTELMPAMLNTRAVSSLFRPRGVSVPLQPAKATSEKLLVYTRPSSNGRLEAYSRYLSSLLSLPVVETLLPIEASLEAIGGNSGRGEIGDSVLLVLDEPDRVWLESLLDGQGGCQPVNQLPGSILLVHRPRLPLRHILLILRIDETDEAAAGWTIRLAAESGAAVTILPIVPPTSAFEHFNGDRSSGLDGLLSPSTQPGAHLRRLLDRLADNHIGGTLRLREGEPDWQLRQEVGMCQKIGEGKSVYDLVIVGAECKEHLYRWFVGELVGPMLHWIDRPLLIAQ